MKYLLLISVLMFSANRSLAENDQTQRILKAWLEMHNAGTEVAVKKFINTYYAPAVLDEMKNLDSHVNFYMTIIRDFGEMQDVVYKTEEDSDNRLKVQLLKRGALLVPEPTPEEILVVEIDLDPKNPKFIRRGLGMGALICYIKR